MWKKGGGRSSCNFFAQQRFFSPDCFQVYTWIPIRPHLRPIIVVDFPSIIDELRHSAINLPRPPPFPDVRPIIGPNYPLLLCSSPSPSTVLPFRTIERPCSIPWAGRQPLVTRSIENHHHRAFLFPSSSPCSFYIPSSRFLIALIHASIAPLPSIICRPPSRNLDLTRPPPSLPPCVSLIGRNGDYFYLEIALGRCWVSVVLSSKEKKKTFAIYREAMAISRRGNGDLERRI